VGKKTSNPGSRAPAASPGSASGGIVWPQSSRYIAEQFGHLPPDVVHKITCERRKVLAGIDSGVLM
jgi:hypothetical protein